jgi:hypothetical protein
MSEPKSTGPLILPANNITRGDIPLGLMQTSSRSRLNRMPHGRHTKEERKKIRILNLSLDGSSHQTGNAAFTLSTPHDLQQSRANTDSHNSRNTQHTRVNKIHLHNAKGHSALPGMFWRTHHTKPDPKIDAGDASLLLFFTLLPYTSAEQGRRRPRRDCCRRRRRRGNC